MPRGAASSSGLDTQRRLSPTDFSIGPHLRTHPLCPSDAERGTSGLGGTRNPWNFSDQNQLVLQFLRQFRAHLRKLESSGTAGLKTLLENLDQYATALAPPLEAIPILKHFKLVIGFDEIICTVYASPALGGVKS